MSRKKHAIQKPIFAGFPHCTNTMEIIPAIAPTMGIFNLSNILIPLPHLFFQKLYHSFPLLLAL
jgi:hypothetical protein